MSAGCGRMESQRTPRHSKHAHNIYRQVHNDSRRKRHQSRLRKGSALTHPVRSHRRGRQLEGIARRSSLGDPGKHDTPRLGSRHPRRPRNPMTATEYKPTRATMTLIYKTQSIREARIVREAARSAGCACIARERTEGFVKCGGSIRLVIWFEVFALPH